MPLSREVLSRYTGLSARKLDKHLTRLVDRGVLGVEADGGEMRWTVRGKPRAPGGPETLERFERIESARAEARARARGAEPVEDDGDDGGGRSMIRASAGLAKGAIGLVSKAGAPLDSRKSKGEKSLLLSAGLSLFGPLGWLYAGSFREAIPASLLYLGLAAIIPSALLWPILWFVLPISSIAGLVYAWSHNRNGQRTPLFLGSGDDED